MNKRKPTPYTGSDYRAICLELCRAIIAIEEMNDLDQAARLLGLLATTARVLAKNLREDKGCRP